MKKLLSVILLFVLVSFTGADLNVFYGVMSYKNNYGSGFTSPRAIVDRNWIDSSRNKARDSVATIANAKVSSVSGTSNRISVTGTTTPAIDISSSYVGQTSITTLGTITTGVWNAGSVTSSSDVSTSGYFSQTAVGGTNAFGLLLRKQTQATFSPLTNQGLFWVNNSGVPLFSIGNPTVDKQILLAGDIPTLSDGETTPTVTAVSNCSGSTATAAQWQRVGSTVTVSGTVTTTVTAASTLTILDISFPVASAITDFSQCIGWAMSGANIVHGNVQGNATNDRAQIVFMAGTTGSQVVSYQYTYRIK